MISVSKTSIAIGVAVALVATATYAASHSSTTNKTVSARHAQMEMIAYHTGVLGGIAKGEIAYDSATVDAAATNIRELAKLDRTAMWVAGTEQGAADGSRAKAEIWTDAAGFAQKFTDLENAANAAIGAADAAAVGAAMAGIGGACKGCHDTYRGPEN
jgi:cytochrome c556